MKEITRIHLAKTPFSAEIDAKKSLEKYLNSIQKNMHAEPEAMREIEARMVELLAERGVSKDGVISHDDVLAVQKQMGEPRDFSDDASEAIDEIEDKDIDDKPAKQLMRDPDNAIIGGVCAGVAAYFNINPLWVRLIAIISPFMTFGTAVLIYVVMWLSMPPARTASDKLRMRGEPVTLASLKKAAADESSAIADGGGAMVVAKIFRYSAGALIFLMTLTVLFGLIVGGVFGVSLVNLLDGLSAQMWAWGLWFSLAIGGIAAVVLGMVLARSVFTWTMNRVSMITTIAATIVISMSMASAGIFGMQTGSEFSYETQHLTRKMDVRMPDTNGVKSIVIEGAMGSVVRTDSDKLRVEASYLNLPSVKKPTIKARRDGDRLILSVDEECPRTMFFGGCRVFSTLADFKIYAPASINVNVNGPARSYYEEGIPENTHIDAESTKTIFE
jgi:membrane protein containing pspC domain